MLFSKVLVRSGSTTAPTRPIPTVSLPRADMSDTAESRYELAESALGRWVIFGAQDYDNRRMSLRRRGSFLQRLRHAHVRVLRVVGCPSCPTTRTRLGGALRPLGSGPVVGTPMAPGPRRPLAPALDAVATPPASPPARYPSAHRPVRTPRTIGANKWMKNSCAACAPRSPRRWRCSVVRNTKLDNLHAGVVPATRTGDYSDVTVIDADGRRIPWPEVSLR